MNGPTAKMIIPTIPTRAKMMLYLKLFRTRGISWKKFVSVASLLVAPQVMFISNMWERLHGREASQWLHYYDLHLQGGVKTYSACETCKDNPPRKMASINVHFRFSSILPNQFLSPIR